MPVLEAQITAPMLEHRFMPSVCRRINNFGFELEMLPNGAFAESRGRRQHRTCHCGAPCCRGEFWEMTPPDPNADYPRLIRLMREASLIEDTEQHGYHCHCERCVPNREGDGTFLTAQSDCTVGVEFVSRILHADDDQDIALIARTADVLAEFYTTSHWRPNGSYNAGNHVHVSNSGNDDGRGMQFHRRTRRLAARLMDACYAAWDWTEVAAGGCATIRAYNAKPVVDGHGVTDNGGVQQEYHSGWYGSWLRANTGYGTCEHRLWNTPRDPQRLFVSIGVSLALTRWAYASVIQSPDRGVFAQSASDAMTEWVEQNRSVLCQQIAAYVPTHPMFDEARRLVLQMGEVGEVIGLPVDDEDHDEGPNPHPYDFPEPEIDDVDYDEPDYHDEDEDYEDEDAW